ncbi:MAG: hypothetical protein PVH11_13355 [Anaerolineae bacterium]
MMDRGDRVLGTMALVGAIVTAIWLVLLIYGVATQGPVETSEQALASVADLDLLHYLTYANATLITITATLLFAGLYVYCRPQEAVWSAMGLAFVPAYTVLNLFAYLSQITIVPRLVDLQPGSSLLLAQMVQSWPGSAVNVLNNLGYAILGIPSLIFGLLLFQRDRRMRLPGGLLALSGAASLAGMVGIVLQNELLSLGSLVSGGLFFLALIPLSANLLGKR